MRDDIFSEEEDEMKKEVINKPPLQQAIDSFYQAQAHRISVSLQRQAKDKRDEDSEFLALLEEKLKETEAMIKKFVVKEVKKHKMAKWLNEVKGAGPLISGLLLSELDPHRAPHASSFWAICGLAVDPDTGEAVRKRKGEKISYNPVLKQACYKLGCSFIKLGKEYRTIYDNSKAYYKAKFPNTVDVKSSGGKIYKKYTPKHIDNMARRRTVKLFLANFWAEWRRVEGLDVGVSYAERIGVHVSRK